MRLVAREEHDRDGGYDERGDRALHAGAPGIRRITAAG
jgi:hypothetical protein